MSCGPEGTFIIENKNNQIAVEVADLKFENEIEELNMIKKLLKNLFQLFLNQQNIISKIRFCRN